MNCLIVDDNKMARIAMKQLASQVEDLTVVGECSNAMDAYNLMNSQPVDILFLDIEMPEMTGLELTRHLGNKRPIIIFTTSKREYAGCLRIECGVKEFLFGKEEFSFALNKIN